jgi:hypothetical protein
MKAQLNQAIEITLKPSLLLLGLLFGITIVSGFILVTLTLSFWIKLIIIALVIFSSLYCILRDCLLLLPWSWRCVEVNRLGELRLTNQQGQQFRPRVQSSSLIHSHLIILNLEQTSLHNSFFKRLPSLILLSSPANTEEHRLLRVWLRWWQHPKD